jgi:hypothetical protein
VNLPSEPVTPAEMLEQTGPQPELLSRGKYSLYKAPDGGMHLAYRPEEAEEDLHLVVPAAMVRMAEAAAAGQGPLGRMKALMGFGGG